MEWNNSPRPGQTASQQAPTAAQKKKSKKGLNFLAGMRVVQVVLLFLVTALLVSLTWFFMLDGKKNGESRYVDTNRLQAVFLNGGQVYFGDIDELNGKYLSMSNIYYLRVNQQVQPNQQTQTNNDISLVKLGCELHGPQDRMLLNREQVIFWENLKDDSQVAKAVKQYREQNPGEQNCTTQAQSSTPNATTQTQTTTPATTEQNSGN